MKYWEYILDSNLSFGVAEHLIHKYKPYYMTRLEWDGMHFYDKYGRYSILFRDGHVEHNMYNKAWGKDKNDWMIVTITDEAVEILENNKLI